MKTMSAREAKSGFGLAIDTARAAPVLIEKHGRSVVIGQLLKNAGMLTMLRRATAAAHHKLLAEMTGHHS